MSHALAMVMAALLFSPGATASVLQPLSLQDLVKQADRIAIVHVESQRAEWTADHSAIYTETTVSVQQVIKGKIQRGDRLTIHSAGGVVGEIGMRVYGASRFTNGEAALVFLQKRGQVSSTVGMTLGKLTIRIVNGKPMVSPNLSGVELLAPQAANEAITSMQPLDEVLQKIARYLPSKELGQ